MEIILSKNSPKDYRGVYLNQTEKIWDVRKCPTFFFLIRNSYGNYIKQKFSKGLQRRIFKP
ncbi:hypothetical protein DW918_12395, partial [Eubacterium ventriosum]